MPRTWTCLQSFPIKMLPAKALLQDLQETSCKELPPRTSTTKNICHGHEHVCKVFQSSCCPPRLSYNIYKKRLAKNFHQKLLPPRPVGLASPANASPSYLILWTHSSVNSCVFDKLINYFCVCVHVHLCAQTCFGISLESIYTTYIRECIHVYNIYKHLNSLLSTSIFKKYFASSDPHHGISRHLFWHKLEKGRSWTKQVETRGGVPCSVRSRRSL